MQTSQSPTICVSSHHRVFWSAPSDDETHREIGIRLWIPESYVSSGGGFIVFLPILDVFPRSPAPMLESPRDGPIESCVPGAGWSPLLRNSRGFHRAPPPPPAKGAENSFSDRSADRTAAAKYLISRKHGSHSQRITRESSSRDKAYQHRGSSRFPINMINRSTTRAIPPNFLMAIAMQNISF